MILRPALQGRMCFSCEIGFARVRLGVPPALHTLAFGRGEAALPIPGLAGKDVFFLHDRAYLRPIGSAPPPLTSRLSEKVNRLCRKDARPSRK